MFFLIVVFAVCVIFRLLTNIYRLYATKYYYKAFCANSPKINEYSKPIGKLFDKAGTQLIAANEIQEEYGLLYHEKISNMLMDDRLHQTISETFQKTIGAYKLRIRENLYPVFWLSIPVYVLNQVNIRPQKAIGLLINITFWLIGVVVAYLLEKYLDTTFLAEYFQLK